MQKNEQERLILFVCVENAGRSQMAEGFFNSKYAPKGYRAMSGGTRPANQINPIAIEVMKEVGIDISKQNSKMVKEDMIRSCSKAVNMGCIEESECPMLFIHDIIDWGIEDPKGKPLENVRKIRNEIERKVKEFAEIIKESNSP
jgi:arsenate reductase (thioredoxin)